MHQPATRLSPSSECASFFCVFWKHFDLRCNYTYLKRSWKTDTKISENSKRKTSISKRSNNFRYWKVLLKIGIGARNALKGKEGVVENQKKVIVICTQWRKNVKWNYRKIKVWIYGRVKAHEISVKSSVVTLCNIAEQKRWPLEEAVLQLICRNERKQAGRPSGPHRWQNQAYDDKRRGWHTRSPAVRLPAC